MSRLREMQKERRERNILMAAREFLSVDGYEGTSIEKIAERAEVSVGTVYNYFHTKADLVLLLFIQDTKDMLEKGREVVSNPSDDVIAAVSELLEVYVEEISRLYNKKLMRDLFASLFGESASSQKEIFKLDFMLTAQLVELIEQLQKRGRLDSGIAKEEAALIIYSVFGLNYILYVTDNDMTLISLLENIRRGIQVIFYGLMPR